MKGHFPLDGVPAQTRAVFQSFPFQSCMTLPPTTIQPSPNPCYAFVVRGWNRLRGQAPQTAAVPRAQSLSLSLSDVIHTNLFQIPATRSQSLAFSPHPASLSPSGRHPPTYWVRTPSSSQKESIKNPQRSMSYLEQIKVFLPLLPSSPN